MQGLGHHPAATTWPGRHAEAREQLIDAGLFDSLLKGRQIAARPSLISGLREASG